MSTLHVVPDLICSIVSAAVSIVFATVLSKRPSFAGSHARRLALWAFGSFLVILFGCTWLFNFNRVARHFPPVAVHWTQAFGMVAGFCITCTGIVAALLWAIPPFREERRQAFRAAGALMLASPAVVAAVGILDRTNFRLSEVRLVVPGLPRDLDGLRIVQVTDMHLSPFLSEAQLARAIDMANETRAHVALMTGDLITRPGDPVDACIRQITRLRADHGVFGCLGNHEVYCQNQDYVTRECGRRGMRILRSESTDLRFGNAVINLAGVDYQQMHTRYLVGTEMLVDRGKLNVLMSHNPDVFDVAAGQGWNVVLAGHTHGGQVNIEILHENLNVARFYTPWVRGTYYGRGSVIYVSSGIGTIGMPVRLGAPPEISLVQLCAS